MPPALVAFLPSKESIQAVAIPTNKIPPPEWKLYPLCWQFLRCPMEKTMKGSLAAAFWEACRRLRSYCWAGANPYSTISNTRYRKMQLELDGESLNVKRGFNIRYGVSAPGTFFETALEHGIFPAIRCDYHLNYFDNRQKTVRRPFCYCFASSGLNLDNGVLYNVASHHLHSH